MILAGGGGHVRSGVPDIGSWCLSWHACEEGALWREGAEAGLADADARSNPIMIDV